MTYPKIVLAGKAALTIKNPVTGQHVKLKMRQRRDRSTGKPSPCYFLYVALLADGDLGYNYAGAYFSDSGRFKLGSNVKVGSRLDINSRFLIRCISKPENLKDTEIEHAGKCCKCGRPLTHPESIRTGLGPECFTSIYGDNLQYTRDVVVGFKSLGLI